MPKNLRLYPFIFLFEVLASSSALAQYNSSYLASVPTIKAMEATKVASGSALIHSGIFVQGYNTPGDGGGGMFIPAVSSSATANGCTVFTATTGRWIRSAYSFLTVDMCGAVGNGTTNDAAAINDGIATVHGGTLYFPAGKTYLYSGRALIFGTNPVTTAMFLAGIGGNGHIKFASVGSTTTDLQIGTACNSASNQVGMSNMDIDFSTAGQDGLELACGSNVRFYNVILNNSKRDLILIDPSGYQFVQSGDFIGLYLNQAGRHAIHEHLSGTNGAFINEINFYDVQIRGVSKRMAGGAAVYADSTATGPGSKFSEQIFDDINADAQWDGVADDMPDLNCNHLVSGNAESWKLRGNSCESTASAIKGGFWLKVEPGAGGALFTIDHPVYGGGWGQYISGLSGNSTIADAGAAGFVVTGPVTAAVYTVATLPPASTTKGARAMVTDSSMALASCIGRVAVGGGANIVPVFSDGAHWNCGG